MVYHLASIPYQTQLTLKVSKENNRDLDDLPSFPSITSVYHAADWHEREAFEMEGIFFEGHPDLRRLLLPDDWDGYPLRKDYFSSTWLSILSYHLFLMDIRSSHPAATIFFRSRVPFKKSPLHFKSFTFTFPLSRPGKQILCLEKMMI